MLFSTAVCFHWLHSVRVVISLRFLPLVFVSPYVDRLPAANYVSVRGGRGSEREKRGFSVVFQNLLPQLHCNALWPQNTLKSITSSRQSEIGCVKVIIKSSLPLTVYSQPTSSRSQFNGHRNHRRFFFTSVSAPVPDDINISAAKGSL